MCCYIGTFEENGCSYEWEFGIDRWYLARSETFVPIVVLGRSSDINLSSSAEDTAEYTGPRTGHTRNFFSRVARAAFSVCCLPKLSSSRAHVMFLFFLQIQTSSSFLFFLQIQTHSCSPPAGLLFGPTNAPVEVSSTEITPTLSGKKALDCLTSLLKASPQVLPHWRWVKDLVGNAGFPTVIAGERQVRTHS